MGCAINKQKVAVVKASKAAIDALMTASNDKDKLSFDEIRAGLSKPGLTDGEIHQALLNAGYEVDV